MKKIVGILAVAAIATSLFAVDIASKLKVSSDLFEYNAKAENLAVFGELKPEGDKYFTVSVSSDVAGAKFVLNGVGKFEDQAIWFKPTEEIKLSFLGNGLSLYADKFNCYNAYGHAATDGGYGIEYAKDAVTFGLTIGNKFVVKAKDTDAVIGDIGAKVEYKADFGSVACVADFKESFKAIALGVGYTNNFDGLELVADASVFFKEGFEKAMVLAYASKNIDAIGLKGLVNVTIPSKTEDLDLVAKAEVSYQLDAVTVAAYFNDADLIKGDANMDFGVKVSGNVGAASWSIDPNYNVGNNTVKVGFETALAF